jgi:hypothetical protein
MRIELPITDTYVSEWGVWEGIREIVQNAIDEQDLHGHQMVVEHDGAMLHVRSIGADMNRAALLLGKTSKQGIEKARGQFGEGLDLALLALTRAGLDVEIRTQQEKWTAKLAPSGEYAGETVLTISTRKMPTQVSWVEVTVRIQADEWEALRPRFLFLDPPPEGEAVKTEYGTIILEERRKGQIFVKGIFVMVSDEISHGYDMSKVKLDRDRRVINAFDLSWATSQMYAEAARRSGDMAQHAYRMLRDGCSDVQYIGSMYVDSETRNRIIEAFEAEHGANALPVTSIAESREMEHAGIRGVIVSASLRQIVESVKGTASAAKARKGRDTQATFAWGDLNETEQNNLTRACGMVDTAVAKILNSADREHTMSRTEVVIFNDLDVMGTANNQCIRIDRRHLSDFRVALSIVVHEEGHCLSLCADMTKGHFDIVEEIWSYIVADLIRPS